MEAYFHKDLFPEIKGPEVILRVKMLTISNVEPIHGLVIADKLLRL